MGWDDMQQALCFVRDIKVEETQERLENFCIDMSGTEAGSGTAELQQRKWPKGRQA
jgi:hypothetical protein